MDVVSGKKKHCAPTQGGGRDRYFPPPHYVSKQGAPTIFQPVEGYLKTKQIYVYEWRGYQPHSLVSNVGGGSFQKQKLNAVMMVSSFMMFILLFPPPPCIELCKIASALSRRVCSSALYKCLCFTENQLQVSAASMITH